MKKTLFTATLLAASLMAASTVQAAPQEVTMWHYFDQKPEQEMLADMVEEYNSLQDDIHINATFVSRTELMNQYTVGTLSGAPKIRACQLIGELENNKRGIYGGAVGYIDFAGNMDTCIAIRMAYKKNGKVFVRSGAGIVADSVPEREYEECLNKAKATLKALELAEEVEE